MNEEIKEENRVCNEVENYYFVQRASVFMIIKIRTAKLWKGSFVTFLKVKKGRGFNGGAKRKY